MRVLSFLFGFVSPSSAALAHCDPVVHREFILCSCDDRTCQIHEEKVKRTEELLRRRELAVKTLEDTYDHRLQNDLSR